MGGCFSGELDRRNYNCSGTAKVITIGGDLLEYGVPVTAGQVLRSRSLSVSSAAAAQFVCSSDRLFYEEFIPELDPEEELADGQIYFVLPRSRLRQRLTASDMAALAVKARVAMQKTEEKRGRSRTRIGTPIRISPSSDVDREAAGSVSDSANQSKIIGAGIESSNRSASESLRRLQKHRSRRLRKAVQSFRIRLSTIHEGTDDVDVEL